MSTPAPVWPRLPVQVSPVRSIVSCFFFFRFLCMSLISRSFSHTDITCVAKCSRELACGHLCVRMCGDTCACSRCAKNMPHAGMPVVKAQSGPSYAEAVHSQPAASLNSSLSRPVARTSHVTLPPRPTLSVSKPSPDLLEGSSRASSPLLIELDDEAVATDVGGPGKVFTSTFEGLNLMD